MIWSFDELPEEQAAAAGGKVRVDGARGTVEVVSRAAIEP